MDKSKHIWIVASRRWGLQSLVHQRSLTDSTGRVDHHQAGKFYFGFLSIGRALENTVTMRSFFLCRILESRTKQLGGAAIMIGSINR